MSVRITAAGPAGASGDGGPDDVRSLFSDSATPPSQGPPELRRPKRGSLHRRRPAAFGRLRHIWPRAAAWLLIVAVAGAVVGGLAWRLSIPAPGAIGKPAVAPSDAVGNTPNPTSGAGQPAESAPAAQPVAPTTTAVAWQGTALPVSTEAGPSTFTATRSAGFADTPQGAALAAVHISTHIDPYTGPRVFTPAITEQVIGAKEGLLSRTQQIYREAADQMGVSGGAPVLVPTGSVQSWRIRDFQSDGSDVELLVATPTGEQVVYRIPVKRVRGDWRLLVPNADGDVFEVSKPRGLSGFTPFIDFPGGAG